MTRQSDSLESSGPRQPASFVSAPISAPTAQGLIPKEPTPEVPIPFGPYLLIRRIGAGGMGEVFLARESGLRPRACVVKKVLPNLVANRAFVGRFIDESKVVVRLKHEHVARVYAMGEVEGEYYLAMEYVQGKTVSRFARRLRDRRHNFPLGLTLLLAEKICLGLDYAHHAVDEHGAPLFLVHRDLSPANVCISYSGEVKIIDFGAAQSTIKEAQTAPRVVIGNLTYMSPEQAKKQIVDARADIYSCGVLLWELVTQQALPQKGDPIARWRKAANPAWEAPSIHNASVPPDVDALVLRALRKDPGERFQSARSFAEALAAARRRHAPDVTERDLGDLLSNVFAKEKKAEDAVLFEAVYGRTLPNIGAEPPRKVRLLPPTALAFEHTGVLAPAEFVPADQAVTDPGEASEGGLPSRARALNVLAQEAEEFQATRTIFGVNVGRATGVKPGDDLESLESRDEMTSEPEETRFYPMGGPGRQWVLYGGVFVVSTLVGFLGVLLSSR